VFEQPNKGSAIFGSGGALNYLIKSNPVRFVFYCGAVPFALLWIFRGSLATGFALQVYLVTTEVFVSGPFRDQQGKVRKRWFWKTMLQCGVAVHPLFLAGMWYLDVTYPSFVIGGATLILLVFVASVLESIILKSLVSRFQSLE
jgi:hypothetical protein